MRGGNVAVGVVDDSPPGRALLARLPLTVQLRDSFGLALIGGVSPSLAIETGPTSCRFQSGEIVYSTGDRSIAILHSPEVSQLRTPGLLRLGVITDGLRGLAGDGAITIRRSW
ncbi:MAG TPA: cyclophilin-like fold protein [Propionicimonas sp.]|nr:cyclophilin-like fold protein [Propionicimonas sp.]